MIRCFLFIRRMKLLFYSSWIANFGVVPLFLFAAFLLAPCFLFLRDLLFFVTRVLETIAHIPILIITSVKTPFLPASTHSVKVFAVVMFLLLPTILVAEGEKVTQFQNIIISIGEHREIPALGLAKFILGNSDAVSYKLLKKPSKRLLIKGKKIGFTELVIWKIDGKKEVHRIYVLSKRKHLKIMHLAQTFRSMGLQADVAGTLIKVSGKINKLDDYLLARKLLKDDSDNLHINATVEKKLANFLIGEIYGMVFDEFVDDISCFFRLVDLVCHHNIYKAPSKELKRYLKDLYDVRFMAVRKQRVIRNYLVKLKMIQIEKLDGQELNFGLDRLSGSVGDLFNIGVDGLIKKNRLLIEGKQIHLSTLAEPQIIVRENHPSLIEVGAEIPFTNLRNGGNESVTQWKFAGLRIKIDIKQMGDKVRVKFDTRFTYPGKQNWIAGSREKSSAVIELNNPTTLFQIGFKTNGLKKSEIPYISKIPLLGALFQSKSKEVNYKKITGVIIVEEYKEDRGIL